MQLLPERIRCRSIFQLSLPGSHDSGSYELDVCQDFSKDIKRQFRNWRRLLRLLSKRRVLCWARTQTISIGQQLQLGVRYFDFRVVSVQVDKVKKKTELEEGFRFCHALHGPSIFVLCDQINTFLTDHTGEVVIIDFQHFYDFQLQDHRFLIQKCLQIFGQKLCPRSFQTRLGEEMTLNLLHQQNIQIILVYREPVIFALLEVDFFWTEESICNPFANTNSVKHLLDRLVVHLQQRDSLKFHVFQGVLTFGFKNCFSLLRGNLFDDLARHCNKSLLDWLRQLNPPQPQPNIVMFDFVNSYELELIKQVINLNYRFDDQNKSFQVNLI